MKEFKCNVCDEYFSTSGDLKSHVNEHHNKSQKEVLIKKHNELVSRITNQKIKIYNDIYKVKQKEIKQKSSCNCRGNVCIINHSRFRWLASKSDVNFSRLSALILTKNSIKASESEKLCEQIDCLKCYPELGIEDSVKTHIKKRHQSRSGLPSKQCDETFEDKKK